MENKGVFLGTVLLSESGTFGGARSVFVKLQGQKDNLVFPTFGGNLENPFPVAPAKIFAGDLFEFRTDDDGLNPKLFLLKTYKVAKQSSSETTVLIEKDGYKHIPCVGDVLMKAPDEIGGTGAAYTVTKVEETTEESKAVWKLTFGTTLGELAKGDVLVEAESENASGTMKVKNINAVAPSDYDMLFNPATESNKNGARYQLTPALRATMYISRMSPVPPCVLKLNKSRVNGWFEL